MPFDFSELLILRKRTRLRRVFLVRALQRTPLLEIIEDETPVLGVVDALRLVLHRLQNVILELMFSHGLQLRLGRDELGFYLASLIVADNGFF